MKWSSTPDRPTAISVGIFGERKMRKKNTRKDFSQRLVNEIKTETYTTCMPTTMNLSRALRQRDRVRARRFDVMQFVFAMLDSGKCKYTKRCVLDRTRSLLNIFMHVFNSMFYFI